MFLCRSRIPEEMVVLHCEWDSVGAEAGEEDVVARGGCECHCECRCECVEAGGENAVVGGTRSRCESESESGTGVDRRDRD